MRRAFVILLCFAACSAAAGAQTIERYTNLCSQGAGAAVVQGLQSSNKLETAFPTCHVTVYLTGTNTLATLYSNRSLTPLANPFTALTSGIYGFYASVSNNYDVVMTATGMATTTVPDVNLGGNGGGTPTVVEVNSTPISPASPANFVDTATVTWAFTGGQIKATATGGGGSGCTLSALPNASVIFTPDGTTCAGDGNFSYFPADGGHGSVVLNSNQDGSRTDLLIEAQRDSSGGVGANETNLNGQNISIFSDGGGFIIPQGMLGVDVEMNDASYPGDASQNLAGYQSILEPIIAGRPVIGYDSAINLSGADASFVEGFLSESPTGLAKAADVYGFRANNFGGDRSTGDNYAYFADDTTVTDSTFCDFFAKSGITPRLAIGCGPSAASTFYGPVTVADTGGNPSQINLLQNGVAPATVANGSSIAAAATVTTPSVIVLPDAPCTGYLRALTDTSGVMPITCGSGGGASGFPITLGSTPIAASSTTTALAGLALTTSSINGVTPSTTAGSGNFLNGAGGYSSPGGISVKIKYVSVEGCPQDTDLTAGGGTDATTCINALWAGASPTNPILVVQDGASLISGNGVQMPAGGGAFLQGSGGGISQVAITNCSLTSNVATFTTEPQAPLITVGQNVQLAALSTCSALNGEVVTALSSGLASTQFKANFTHANISSGAEVATGKTVYGTGFYLADGSGDAVSNGRVPSAGSCEIPAGTPPSRGAGLGISNLVINGNAANQTNYCFLVDLDNANNIFVDNVTLYNAAHYGVHMGNVGQVKITRSSFIAAQAYLGAMVTTDGIHMTGPWNDLTIANDYFNTGDDAIALNSAEGYCGPGDRTEITNSTSYSSLRMLRIYNNGAVCGNGLSPLVDTVNISNYSGSAYGNIADLGFAIIGTLNPAITNVTWANSDVKATTTGLHGIEVVNNIGRLSFDDFTTEGFGSCLLCSSVGSQSIALLKLHNVSFVGNSIGGSSFIAPLGAVAGGGTPTVTDAIVDGLGEYNDTGGTISANCPFCSGAVTNLYASNIDMNLFNTFADSSVTNLIGQAGPNSWARNPAGGPWTFHAYGGGAGFDFYPHSSGGSAFNRFYDVAGKTLFCMDTNNEWMKVGGLAAYPTCDGLSDTAEPIFFGSGFINWNRQPGNNGPIFGNVGNWPWFHSPSGTASADCIHMQAQAFGAGGPSDVLVQCADGAVSIPGALTVGSCSGCGGGSSGISGLTSGFIPLAGSATTLTGNSPFDYGVTTAGVVTLNSGGTSNALTVKSSATASTGISVQNTSGAYEYQFFVAGSANGNPGSFGIYNYANSHQPITLLANDDVLYIGNVTTSSGKVYGWNADTGLSRDSAGVVDVGNGTAGDKSGTLNAATYGAGALANGMTATTQAVGTNNTAVATGQFVLANRGTHNYSVTVQPGLFATSAMLGQVFYEPVAASLNIVTVRVEGAISCSVAPTVNLLDLGTTATTAYGSATVISSNPTALTSDGVYTSGASLGVALAAGHYFGFGLGAGTCATAPTLDISAQVQ